MSYFPDMKIHYGICVYIYGHSMNQATSLHLSTSPEPSLSASAHIQLLPPTPFGKQRCPSPHAPLWNWQAFDTERERKTNLLKSRTCYKIRLLIITWKRKPDGLGTSNTLMCRRSQFQHQLDWVQIFPICFPISSSTLCMWRTPDLHHGSGLSLSCRSTLPAK